MCTWTTSRMRAKCCICFRGRTIRTTSCLPQAELVLGDPRQGKPVWQIGPPFGQDLLVALVARRPLYQDRRPDVEAIEPYLTFLRDRMASEPPEDAVRMAYRIVETMPR